MAVARRKRHNKLAGRIYRVRRRYAHKSQMTRLFRRPCSRPDPPTRLSPFPPSAHGGPHCRRDCSLPASVLGPVLFNALRRLGSICRNVLMGAEGEAPCPGQAVYFSLVARFPASGLREFSRNALHPIVAALQEAERQRNSAWLRGKARRLLSLQAPLAVGIYPSESAPLTLAMTVRVSVWPRDRI
jgi:hypothetical protein